VFLFVKENIEWSPTDMSKFINTDLKLGINLAEAEYSNWKTGKT
jgi:hypothetical protein